MIIVSYGGGTNSTALLIECVKRNIKIDLILFADTGGERPNTYAYVDMFSDWLVKNGLPEITFVKKGGNGETLEEECKRKSCLPPIAYGFKTCSLKYKKAPTDVYCNNNDLCKEAWDHGKITKYIGFDADESHRVKDFTDDKYIIEYPLVEWDMGRDECLETIKKEGLCLPGKSACFFCPSSKPSEVRHLKANFPELADRALAMEARAELTSIKGLGRNWNWKALLANDEMFDDYLTPELTCDCYDG